MAAKKKGPTKRQLMRAGRKKRVGAAKPQSGKGRKAVKSFVSVRSGEDRNRVQRYAGGRQGGTVRRREGGKIVTRRIVGVAAGSIRKTRFTASGYDFPGVGNDPTRGRRLVRTTVTRGRQG